MSARLLRRGAQILTFLLFAFLFLNTEYTDRDVLPYAVNIFLRLDPLVAGAASLASRTLSALLWPALITVGATLLLGRFFCGWLCPLGSILDFTGLFLKKKRLLKAYSQRLASLKYLILALLAGSSLFTLQLVFIFDPISILIRSLAVAVYPAMNLAANALFNSLYETDLAPVTAVSEPVYTFLKNHFLAFEQPHFQGVLLTGIIFLGILALELLGRRFWCRNLCPLGALLGLLGKFGLVARKVDEERCTSCAKCRATCRMEAVSEDYHATDRAECIQCLDCAEVCPEDAIGFMKTAPSKALPFSPGRRALLTAAGLGVAAAPLMASEAIEKTGDPKRIRPPGALPEKEFLARCTRCGECMRVCIANGLQPAMHEAGFAGLWSPVLVPRIGYCEYNCTLCGQVCPTGAITRMEPEVKQKVRIGLADVDRSRCLPWKGESECIVCEEHCPTPQKAIFLREEEVALAATGEVVKLQRPYVDENRCIGCGICETKCPLSDRAAIIVSSRGESRAEKG